MSMLKGKTTYDQFVRVTVSIPRLLFILKSLADKEGRV